MTDAHHRHRTPQRRRFALSSEQLVVALLFVVVTVFATMVQAQTDTWWQLRSGQEIWEQGTVSYVERYSHTARGAYWPNHEWLTEVLFHAAHSTGGMPLLAAFCAFAIVVAYVLSWRLLTGRFEVRVVLFVGSLTAAVGAWSIRPQVVTLACFMIVCTLLAKGRIVALPPLFLLWANLHGAVAVGLFAIGAVIVYDTLTERRFPWRLVSIALVCLAATVATPLGIGLWELLISYSRRTKTQGISEWAAPGAPPEYLAFWVIAALLVLGAVLRWRDMTKPARRLAAIGLAVLPLALAAHRNVALFLLVAVPAVSAVLAGPSQQSTASSPRDFSVGNTVFAGFTAVVAAVFVGWTWMHPPERLGWRPITPGAMAAIRECRQPLYNALGIGGTIIGFVPEQAVFIDNRNDPYPVHLLESNRLLEESGQYETLFATYGIACAVVEPDSHTDARLKADSGWRSTYRDHRFVVYEKSNSRQPSPDSRPR